MEFRVRSVFVHNCAEYANCQEVSEALHAGAVRAENKLKRKSQANIKHYPTQSIIWCFSVWPVIDILRK